MGRLKLAEIEVIVCSKPRCSNRLIQRHHRGCEHMWLKHFKRRSRSARYRWFKQRYELFHDDDCVKICEAHHNEIHLLYMEEIRKALAETGYPATPLKEWTWEMAEALMDHLRKVCDKWIKTETPGLKRRKALKWDTKKKSTGR